MKKKLLLLLVISITIASMAACAGKTADRNRYEEAYIREDLSIHQLKSVAISAITKLFVPSKKEDMQLGLKALQPYLTEECFDEMSENCVYRADGTVYMLENLTVEYCSAENSGDNTRKICAFFDIIKSGSAGTKDFVVFELSLNGDGRIYRCNVYRRRYR